MEFIFETLTALRAYGPAALFMIFFGSACYLNICKDETVPKLANVLWYGVLYGVFFGGTVWVILSTLLGAIGIPL